MIFTSLVIYTYAYVIIVSVHHAIFNKTSGIDNIGSYVLESCATALTAPLHYLFR